MPYYVSAPLVQLLLVIQNHDAMPGWQGVEPDMWGAPDSTDLDPNTGVLDPQVRSRTTSVSRIFCIS